MMIAIVAVIVVVTMIATAIVIVKMIAKYRAETIDIEDVEYEEADLEEDVLFNDESNEQDKANIL